MAERQFTVSFYQSWQRSARFLRDASGAPRLFTTRRDAHNAANARNIPGQWFQIAEVFDSPTESYL